MVLYSARMPLSEVYHRDRPVMIKLGGQLDNGTEKHRTCIGDGQKDFSTRCM